MSVGFRKGLFGFNCDDVLRYIEISQQKFSQSEAAHKVQISELNSELSSAKAKIDELALECESLVAELNEFKNKRDELDRLSTSIGKLYLVSQSSAKSVIENSVKSSEIAGAEVSKNIESIDKTHGELVDIKQSLEQTTADFIARISSLCASLESAKAELEERNCNSDKHLAEFTAMFNRINNAE